MDRTQEINLLLEKVNTANELSKLTYREFNRKNENHKTQMIELNGIPILKKGIQTFKHSKRALNQIELDVFNEFLNIKVDKFLFSLLNINFKHYHTSWSNRAGWWDGKTIAINNNFAHKSSRLKTLYHEIGHAWASQLPRLAGIENYEWQRNIILKFLNKMGIIVYKRRKIIDHYRKSIWDNISFYGGNSYEEAFAELFAHAHCTGSKNHLVAREVIDSENEKLKVMIWNNINKK